MTTPRNTAYRAPGARAGFAPSRAPQPRQRAPQPRPQRAPHPAWHIVRADLERRQRRCRFIIDPHGQHPDHPDRLAALEKNPRESYQAEIVDIRRRLRVCDRAIGECWAEVPAGVNAALADVERARSRLERGVGPREAALKGLWRAFDTLQRRLFRPAQRRAA